MNKLILAFIVLNGLSWSADADWISTQGKVISPSGILVYTDDRVLVKLTTDGVSVAECSDKHYFAISTSISSETRNRVYSMLLSAQATGRDVIIYYEDTGNCEPTGATRKILRVQ